ncbi:sigma 54-interacting transcriptional regulator [Sandaracinus amylolyticus]|uniref:Nitrogen regulation protein NtrC n=1 Tax=Sandaracinus amylolyticus TaxID=927083 RepID=A0A0F6VZI4_9BACT|nr:sigma 54-interacting transcriptional regulator [Sandaracinus amylolyticus]AKF03612.1 Nitrogen regulation protein NtrC [Sandaracinus amylolyticus]
MPKTIDDAPTEDFELSLHGARAVRGPREVHALVIAWSRAEPDRVGEVARIERACVLGRGSAPASDGAPRARFVRQRPWGDGPSEPLASPRLSREQLRIEPTAKGLRVASIGRAPMWISGEPATEREIVPGDTVRIADELLLLAVRRPTRMDAQRAWGEDEAPFAFGAPDRFGLVGESVAAWTLRDRVAFAARADAHVLLLGASGTGKELVARAIHQLSSRASGPLVARNAATLPEGLVDAELFGNVRNYPNPGMAERPGLVGEADKGTLFLDEIGEMPSTAQAHLLRVLDRDGEYQRLGDARPRRASIRVVGATNRARDELKHDVRARFGIVLEIPQLDARPDDVPLLVRHLVSIAATKTRVPAPEPSIELVDALLRHRYELNVRELEQLLWQAMAESRAGKLELVPSLVDRLATPEREGEPAGEEKEPDREAIEAAIARAGGSVTKAARELGLRNRYVLYRLLRKHGIAVDGL